MMSMQTEKPHPRVESALARTPDSYRPAGSAHHANDPTELRRNTSPFRARSHATRILHLALALIVLHQLVGSNFMEAPLPGDDPELPFILHQWMGLAGFAFVFLFWLWTCLRDPRETRISKLVPWFSASRSRAVFRDVRASLRELGALRPPSDSHDALASAVHGIGLLILSFMALTGASWFLFLGGMPIGKIVMDLHRFAANLMWAYLVGHASIAVLHHFLGSDVLSQMIWMRRRARANSPEAQ
jgi:cytochrome b561